MFIDKCSKMPDKEITNIVNALRRFGSHYQDIQYIHEDPLFVTSNDRSLLQIADAVSYCTLKQLCMNKWFRPYWQTIKQKFRKDPSGNILGYGLKIFPRKGNEVISSWTDHHTTSGYVTHIASAIIIIYHQKYNTFQDIPNSCNSFIPFTLSNSIHNVSFVV
jgi:hypothetical protein